MGRLRNRLRRLVFLFLTLALVLSLFEGCSSFVLLGLDFWTAKPPETQRGHTRYDADLGWSSQPGAWLPGFYGPGLSIRINGQGFRNEQDFPVESPAGKLRVVCSGDSFTFGHGVANGQTWPDQLQAVESKLETVNMGQGAYGLDQAYLWYRRDGQTLEHQIHLVAFITDNLVRMQRDQFDGYGKPILRLVEGRLETLNVPVPERSDWAPWLERGADQLEQLRSTRLLRSLHARLFPAGLIQTPTTTVSQEVRQVLPLLFGDLQRMAAASNRLVVLIHLPIRNEVRSDPDWQGWRTPVLEEARKLGIPLFDLTEDFGKLLPRDQDALFLTPRGGHYSSRGNRFVAERIHARLSAMPDFQEKLASLR